MRRPRVRAHAKTSDHVSQMLHRDDARWRSRATSRTPTPTPGAPQGRAIMTVIAMLVLHAAGLRSCVCGAHQDSRALRDARGTLRRCAARATRRTLRRVPAVAAAIPASAIIYGCAQGLGPQFVFYTAASCGYPCQLGSVCTRRQGARRRAGGASGRVARSWRTTPSEGMSICPVLILRTYDGCSGCNPACMAGTEWNRPILLDPTTTIASSIVSGHALLTPMSLSTSV
jgi:hypothetical protein